MLALEENLKTLYSNSKFGILTAGHDFDKIEFPIKLGLGQGNENFIGISKKEQFLTKNDMMLCDGKGIMSSILNGPDSRTQITKDTKNVMFFIYTPDGIGDDIIRNHLYDIKDYIILLEKLASKQIILNPMKTIKQTYILNYHIK